MTAFASRVCMLFVLPEISSQIRDPPVVLCPASGTVTVFG